MTSPHSESVLKFAILDPLLYGAARAVDYLGFRGQDLLDKVGDGILHYATSEGYVQSSNDPHQFTGNVAKFFTENGYMSNVSVKQDGNTLEIGMSEWRFLPLMRKLRDRNSYLLTCPVCIANNAITRSAGGVTERISEDITMDGSWTMKVRIVPGTHHVERSVIPAQPADFGRAHLANQSNETVGTPAFETVTYALAYGFDFLGAQAQLLLDNAGTGMIEFMREEAKLALPDELGDALKTLSTFACKGGLADHISTEVSQSEVRVDFQNSRYRRVLKRLMSEGRRLVSCPFTLSARSIIKTKGLGVGDMSWQIAGDDIRLVMKTSDMQAEDFSEENVSTLMDRA